MPLSEHEQRQLEAIERALVADDPKFASAVRFADPRARGRRRLLLGVIVVLLGLSALLVGAVASLLWVGVLGFLIMLFGAMQGTTAIRLMRAPAVPPSRSQVEPGGFQPTVVRDAGPTLSRGRSSADPRIAGSPAASRRPARRRSQPRQPRAGSWRGNIVENLEDRWRRRFDTE